MPANVGQMFYTGQMPWHGQGTYKEKPVNVHEAVQAGGLNWEVGEAPLFAVGPPPVPRREEYDDGDFFGDYFTQVARWRVRDSFRNLHLFTRDFPPTPVAKRKAIVRLDLPWDDERRVLAVVYPGFKPIQNRDAAMLFDEIFGRGQEVYHTGGYLGNGEVIWLLAKVGQPFEVGSSDHVDTYALLANSHDGSLALQIRLTTVRVVCQNTLYMALEEDRLIETLFRRAHKGTIHKHREAAREFYEATLEQLNAVRRAYVQLTKKQCDDDTFRHIVRTLLPKPARPRNVDRNLGVRRAYQLRLEAVRAARRKILELRESGKGMELASSQGTFWGALNAVLEYVDHHKPIKVNRYAHALLGTGMDFKRKAFQLIWKHAMAT